MISKICGKLKSKANDSVEVDINGISYEVIIPSAIMRILLDRVKDGDTIELVTYHYYQTDPSKSIPVLVGFLNDIEKEFFEKFITVSGIGPKAACRALSKPFSIIADAIDSADMVSLKELPGIGEQRAREIIAKLQGKVGKFGLIQDKGSIKKAGPEKDGVTQEAIAVLLQLQYKRNEAMVMVRTAMDRNPSIKSCEDLLNEVYKLKK